MMKKSALGRGLDALMPQVDEQYAGQEVDINLLDINPNQPRKAFDQEAMAQLADSIREVGLLQPILVQRTGGRYRIIAGERRYRACRLAGLTRVPVIERDMSGEESMLAALIENLQREDLNPMEEAAAIRQLMDTAGLTQEEAAGRLGKSRPAVANTLRLLTLPAKLQKLVRDGRLSEGHARVLAGVKGVALQEKLAERAVAEGLSVRAFEALCRKAQEEAPQKPAPKRLAPELDDFARRLQRATGVRASIQGDLNRGKVTLSYHSAQELDSLYRALEQVLP